MPINLFLIIDMDSSLASSTKKSVMVLDDEPDIAEILGIALDKSYHVTTFTEPLKALDSFEAGKYDLVIVDYLMPDIDGFSIYEKLKAVDPAVRVCIMTAYEIFRSTLHKKRFDSLNPPLNPESIIRKPFTTSEIFGAIERTLAAEAKPKPTWYLAAVTG